MSHLIVLPKRTVDNLLEAAVRIHTLMDDSTIGNAFCGGTAEQVHDAITAFDNLDAAAKALSAEQKTASPFLRYRREILGNYDTARRLRDMVLNLWGGQPANFSLLFHGADEHHTRIALECIVSFTHLGENDSQFMSLAAEIIEALPAVDFSGEEKYLGEVAA